MTDKNEDQNKFLDELKKAVNEKLPSENKPLLEGDDENPPEPEPIETPLIHSQLNVPLKESVKPQNVEIRKIIPNGKGLNQDEVEKITKQLFILPDEKIEENISRAKTHLVLLIREKKRRSLSEKIEAELNKVIYS